MDAFAKITMLFQALVSQLTLPGLLLIVLCGLSLCIWCMLSAKGQMVMFVLAFVFTMLSMDVGRHLPKFLVSPSYTLKWVFIIPLVLRGLYLLICGRGTSFVVSVALGVLCFYILTRAFFSGAWDRYFLWVAMVMGLPSLGVYFVRNLGPIKLYGMLFSIVYIFLFLSLFQFFYSHRVTFSGYRYSGFLPNPNEAGTAIVCIMIPGIWLYFERPHKRLLMVALIVMGVLLFMTGSRAAWLQILPVILLVILKYAKRPSLWLGIFLVGVVFLVCSLFVFNEAILNRVKSTGTSGRWEIWVDYWNLSMQSPYFGHGMGYMEAMELYVTHNGLMYILVEAGMVGVVTVIVSLLVAIFYNPGHKYYALFPQYKALHLFVIAQLIGFQLNGLFEAWLIGVGFYQLPMFLLFLGVCDGVNCVVRQEGILYWQNSFFVGQSDYRWGVSTNTSPDVEMA